MTQYWGRIFGPYGDDKGSGSLWTSGTIYDESLFSEMVKQKDWCIGGDRIWLAPEVQYNIPDRFSDITKNGYSLQTQIDPGHYTLHITAIGDVLLYQDMKLKLYNTAAGIKHLSLKRLISPAMDPIRCVRGYENISKKVKYTGYTQMIQLKDRTPDSAMTEIWNLIQVNPGGFAIIPVAGEVEYQDYYAPIDPSYMKVTEKAIFLKLTGGRKYKVGVKSACVFGRVGYIEDIEGEDVRLIVRNFFNNPSFPYIDEPIKKPGSSGDSLQIYNDDGNLGGFGEIEVHGCAVGGNTGRKESRDIIDFWQYVGKKEEIWLVAKLLLGIDNLPGT